MGESQHLAGDCKYYTVLLLYIKQGGKEAPKVLFPHQGETSGLFSRFFKEQRKRIK